MQRTLKSKSSLARNDTIAHEYFRAYLSAEQTAATTLIVLHQRYDGGGDTGAHHHEDFYALYVVQSGRGVHVINDHPYQIARGDVYITPPGTTHRYRDYHELRAEAFCFQADFFRDEELHALRGLPGFWNLLVTPDQTESARLRDYHLHLSPERHRDVESMIDEINNEQGKEAAVSRALVRSLFFRLLVYLARQHAQQITIGRDTSTRNAMNTAHNMADVLRFCEAHFHEPLSVPQLAAMMFLSPGRFSEVFTRALGMPPATYLRRLRLERAQTLLRTTSLSTTEIAHSVGFSDLAQLSRAFRAAFGTTPSAYRATYKT
ncbi:MAG TPA: AraC family transcriptional regulator [Abditibacteriaceae bacterium]|jgi:AraC-like DNA-binding protein/mannose-6-phosphate isomerase-like protein (cupin superfamily)